MSASATLIVVMAVLYAAGVYAMLERSLTRVLIGFLLLGNATNLLLLIAMGFPGVSPFYGAEGRQSDPLPQALMLTAIVITFAISAFLLALIYRSWQLGQADTVVDDEEDLALAERAADTEDVMEDEEIDADEEDEATTDFVDVVAAPLTVESARIPDQRSPQPDDSGGARRSEGSAAGPSAPSPGPRAEATRDPSDRSHQPLRSDSREDDPATEQADRTERPGDGPEERTDPMTGRTDDDGDDAGGDR